MLRDSLVKRLDMIQIAIRDDDMNFFTTVEDIEFVYRDFNNFPVSFAVIPAVKDISTKGACPETKGNSEPQSFVKNGKLVKWLKDKLSSGEADALFHGINHDYKYIKGNRFAEMEWRDKEADLYSSIATYKSVLEKALNYKITCFVAPSNKISKSCLDAVVKNQMDFSGIVPIKFQRHFSIRNVLNYVKRWWHRIVDGLPWPGVMKYSDHLEVNACLLQSGQYLRKMYDYCVKHNLPMVINVHYWHLRDNPQELEMLRSFIMDYAIPNGAIPSPISKILNSHR